MIRIDQPFVRRGVEHGAMVELAAVGVGVGVGVKVHQRHFAEVFSVRAQQRQGDKVIAAEGEHAFARRQQFFRVRLQLLAHFTRIAEGVNQIAAVHHVQALAHVEVPREAVVLPGQVGGNLTDRRRAVAAAGTTRGCHIKRYAGNDPVCVAVVRHKVHRQTQETKRVGNQGVIVLMT